MRMTNTKPWWKEFNRRVTCIERTYTTTATIISPGQPKKAMVCCFLDWDTRQDYYVVLPHTVGFGMGDYELECLVRDAFKVFWNLLSPCVRIIALDENQRLQAASSNPAELIGFPEEGVNTLVSYFAWPRFEDVKEICHLETVDRSHLIEIDRLAPRVDVMEDNRNGQQIVAKWFLGDARHAWREMLALQSMPLHPHIVPIHNIILDGERIVGWSSKRVDGTDLEIDKSQFKMKWLMQLTRTLDYIHLELGILHGDLQLKNILVEKATDKILLIDFENAAMMDETQLQWEFNQLTWSVYEIITHDLALVEEKLYDITPDDENPDAFYACDPSVINGMLEWPVRTNLDCKSEEIRQYLQNWIQRRKALCMTTPKTPVRISHAGLPRPSPAVMQNREARKARFEEIQKRQREQQGEKELLPVGEVRWERPDYATAYPGRANKTDTPSTSGQSVPRKRSVSPDPSGIFQQEEGKLLADVEEGEPRCKRAKVSDTTIAQKEDVPCQKRHAESETVKSPISPNGSTILDVAKASDGK
ncbi:hypothetical protein FHL15_010732 [Xylaria flabelliformis]|uniref:Protein kinase domain-containing protein n=1 Tax=Xylaria flabelliformis TaxID=2512241 RepID=A0A553HK81_9PEZI|nr:hypothetical protein FHL15_010732 [Xylaria flabelliformis]